jgi:hypothetical protein
VEDVLSVQGEIGELFIELLNKKGVVFKIKHYKKGYVTTMFYDGTFVSKSTLLLAPRHLAPRADHH